MAGYVLSAAAVAKLRRALAPKAGSSSRPGAGASPVAFDNFAAPFTVRWSATEADGAWVMWLPDKTRCVSVAGAYVTPTGITAADDLPAGWYTIDNADSQATALYLVLTTDDSTGATTAAIDTAAGTASTGETVTNILIASLATDSQTGAKRVRQFVVGALVLTHFGKVPQPFDPTFAADATTGETHISAIGPGYAPWGRKLLQVDSPGSSSRVWTTARGRLGLKITHPATYSDTPTVEIIVAASLPDSTDTISYLPLYDFDNGRITLDLRCYLALGVYE